MTALSDQALVHDLRELVAALDRRVPRLEREGETAIAREALGLRRAALKRIAELERPELERPPSAHDAADDPAPDTLDDLNR